MVAQRGKDMLLKVDRAGSNAFVTVAGMRSRRLNFNAESVDVTDFQSTGRWRELLSGSGVQSVGITGSGIFKDAASDEDMRQIFFNSEIVIWQIIIPDFGTIEAPFQITSLEFAGEHNRELTFDISLESAGAVSFLAST
ncbi:MAG: phage major tail protein, TP901-1 family [Pseudomonadota bacterium]